MKKFYVIHKDVGNCYPCISIQDVAAYLRGRIVPDYLVASEGLPCVTLSQVTYLGMIGELKIWQKHQPQLLMA